VDNSHSQVPRPLPGPASEPTFVDKHAFKRHDWMRFLLCTRLVLQQLLSPPNTAL